MLEAPGFAEYHFSALRTGIMAGAPCPEPLMKRVMNEMRCPEILIGCGQTEASPLTNLTSGSKEEIQSFCRERPAHYKVLQNFRFVD
ncbi:MAG: hypothetical protein Kow006_18060 [Gammaproteobacteria bacterium]